jgi:polysaccharide export outer membrane protein
MKKLQYILISALVGIALSSCVTARKVNYMQDPDKHIPSYADTLSYEDYVLRIGDRLYIYVYSLNEEVQKMYNAGGGSASQMRQQMGNGGGMYGSYDLYTYLVDEEGNIDFPTIGKIYVQGSTTREVKLKLEQELGTLLKDMPGYTTISCEVNIVNRSFSIIGAQSGRYMINKEKMTIFEALAMAGDLKEFNSRSEIKLVREVNGVTTIKTFDARSKDLVNSEFYYIEPNDIIYIRQIPGYSFGINHVTTVIGVTAATISFGVFVYSIVQTGINHVNKYYPKTNPGGNSGTNTTGGGK